jgi:hypothetical protein
VIELVFLLEEASARAMLESLLPRLLPNDLQYRLISFEGKQDLERQLVGKIRGYRNADARFIVLRDLDSHPDCMAVKAKLAALCRAAGRPDALIRIACRELESFYLADLAAVESALGMSGLARHQKKRKFRTPDVLTSPSRELQQLTQGRYQKVGGSRSIGKMLKLENNRSPSFYSLVDGIKRLIPSSE